MLGLRLSWEDEKEKHNSYRAQCAATPLPTKYAEFE